MPDSIAPPETSEPLDRATIDSLRELSDGDGDLLAELFQLFLTDTPPRLDAIEAAIAGGDAPALQRAAHTLKGSAGGLGATRMQAICMELGTPPSAGRRKARRRWPPLFASSTFA